MGGAQPLAGRHGDAAILVVEVDPERIDKRLEIGYLQHRADTLDEALAHDCAARRRARKPISVGLLGNAAEVYPGDSAARHRARHRYGSDVGPRSGLRLRPGRLSVEEVRDIAARDTQRLMARRASPRSSPCHRHARASSIAAPIVFDNGNLIRTHAKTAGVERAFEIPIFTEAFLRPLFCRGIGPFRWIALSNDPADIARIDDYVLERFADNHIVTNWIRLAREHVPFQGLPARIAWLGHGERTELALAVNAMVRDGLLAAPVAFTRDHLDAGAMAHPNIMTENLIDGATRSPIGR